MDGKCSGCQSNDFQQKGSVKVKSLMTVIRCKQVRQRPVSCVFAVVGNVSYHLIPVATHNSRYQKVGRKQLLAPAADGVRLMPRPVVPVT